MAAAAAAKSNAPKVATDDDETRSNPVTMVRLRDPLFVAVVDLFDWIVVCLWTDSTTLNALCLLKPQTRFLLAERMKFRDSSGSFSLLLQSVQLACKVIANSVRRAGTPPTY
jgi:hypothetical protein